MSGNGDGQFSNTCVYNTVLTGTPTNQQECNLFWWHLRLAGFVGGPTAAGAAAGQQPANAANGIMGVQTSGLGFTSNIMCSSNLPDKIAIAVDTQMDDSTASSGQVRAYLQTGPSPAVPATSTADVFAETGTNQYLLCKNL